MISAPTPIQGNHNPVTSIGNNDTVRTPWGCFWLLKQNITTLLPVEYSQRCNANFDIEIK